MVVFECVRMKFSCLPGFQSEIWARIFKNSEFLILFPWFLVRILEWAGNSFFFFLTGSESLSSSFSSSSFQLLGFLWSHWIRGFWLWIQCLNCRNSSSVMKIQLNLWELYEKLHLICLKLLLKWLGFVGIVLQFFLSLCNLDLTDMREKVENVFVMWQNFCGSGSDSDTRGLI